jgi:hypothetical protein
MEKQPLAENIKKWLECDSKIASLQKELKQLKKIKKECTDGLKTIMKEREIESVNVSNVGQIQYTKNEVKKSINKKYLNEILNQYYSETPQAAKEICDYILENRETQIRENIRLKK